MKIKIRIKRKTHLTVITALAIAASVHLVAPSLQSIGAPLEKERAKYTMGIQPGQAPPIQIKQKEIKEYKDAKYTEENKAIYKLASMGVMGNVTEGMYYPERLITQEEIKTVEENLQNYGIVITIMRIKTRQAIAEEVVEIIESNGIVIDEIQVELIPREKERKVTPTRGKYTREIGTFNASAYDLSYQSCGKKSNHPLYGITANGDSLVGQNREQAMTIAADTTIIPMGSKVYVEFTEPGYEHFSGVYTVRDRGGAIKGNKIDIFMGDFKQHAPSKEAIDFGRLNVKVYRVAQ